MQEDRVMADSWIKVENSTLDKIEVAKLSTAMGMDPYAVVGRLIRIWSYFDIQSHEGRIDGIDATFLDRMVQHPGFCQQLAAVGWMNIDDDGITLPNFDRHNGGGAKSRAQGANRQSKSRHNKKERKTLPTERDKSNAPRNGEALRGALPEERREEKRRQEQDPHADGQGVLPFAPIEPPSAIPADPAIELGQEFAFAGGEGNSPAAVSRASAVMRDLLNAGKTPDEIRAELNRPGRLTSEHPGDFRRRLLPSPRGSNNGNQPDAYAGFREFIDGTG
jgi:hypothetical protein